MLFQVIPVLDLSEWPSGPCRRRTTRPLSTDSKHLARRLLNRFRWPALSRDSLGLQTLYLADLDAIGGRPPCLDIYREIIASGFHLWIDAGVRDVESLAPLLELDPCFEYDHRRPRDRAGPTRADRNRGAGRSRPRYLQSRPVRRTIQESRRRQPGGPKIPASWPKPRSSAACATC